MRWPTHRQAAKILDPEAKLFVTAKARPRFNRSRAALQDCALLDIYHEGTTCHQSDDRCRKNHYIPKRIYNGYCVPIPLLLKVLVGVTLRPGANSFNS